jgi:hypothetical protein
MTLHRFSAAAKARAERAYLREPARPLAEIARTELAISPSHFNHCIRQWGWPPRRAVKVALKGDAALAASGEGSLLERLEGVLAQRLRVAERSPEDLDRALASVPKLVAAITALRKLEASAAPQTPATDGSAHDEPQRSLEELRQELARHLDRLAADERRRRRDPELHGAGGADPD